MCAAYTCTRSGGSFNSGTQKACASCNLGFVYQGQVITVGTIGIPGSSRTNGRAMLWLYDGSNQVASSWNYNNTYDAFINYTVPKTSGYTLIEVRLPPGASVARL